MVVAIAMRKESASAGGKMDQPNQAGLALDEGSDRRALVLTDDEITFPMPWLAAVTGSEWPLMDRQHRLGEPRTAPAGPLVCPAMSSAGAQRATMWRPDLWRPDQA